jgi:hypothetical protein
LEDLDTGLLAPELDARRRHEATCRRRDRHVGSSRIVHWLKGGTRPEPVPSVIGVLEEPRAERYGICCSGGGIRSASFNLGALQVLQDRASGCVLQRATYLAAVSGGSYMAAGLAMVAKVGRPGEGSDDSDPELVTEDAPAFCAGSPEEQYLRNRSSYMAPGVAGKLRLVTRVVLGAAVNLIYLGSVLFLVGWAIGWLYGRWWYPGLETREAVDTGWGLWVPVGILGAGVVLGLAGTVIRFRRQWLLTAVRAWAGRLLVLGLVAAVLVVALPELIAWLQRGPAKGSNVDDSKRGAAVAGGTGALSVVGVALLALRARLLDLRIVRQASASATKGARQFVSERVLPRIRTGAVLLTAAAVGPLLLGGFFVVCVLLNLHDGGDDPWLLLAGAAAVFVGLSIFGEATTWSLHPFYKHRLSSTFALKRVQGPDGPEAVRRSDERQVKLSEADPVSGGDRPWPLLLVCAAANVSDAGATPPGRGVTSFTFSPSAIGGPLVGGIATETFEQALEHRAEDYTLPAAVAMSGAALAPSMGKLTRWPVRFLLTLANARLGVWLPNPRRLPPERRRGWRHRVLWRPRPDLLLRELLGRNHLDARFLYVTDGGHYENLGLVELLRRGCRDVLCFDASGGRDVQELGDAIALARSELGVEIDIEPEALVPDAETGVAGACCVAGTITFPASVSGPREGHLVYVRCVMAPGAPHDVVAYHQIDPAFPHDSTGEQLYTDQRFEAYRALGRHAAARAVAEWRSVRAAREAAT